MTEETALPSALDAEPFCYLTTTGRTTGRPHEIEIWFALSGSTLYMMSGDEGRPGGKADWVRNLHKQRAVRLRIRDVTFNATARIVTDPAEDALARRLLVQKYASPRDNLESWGRTALPVAIDLPAKLTHTSPSR